MLLGVEILNIYAHRVMTIIGSHYSYGTCIVIVVCWEHLEAIIEVWTLAWHVVSQVNLKFWLKVISGSRRIKSLVPNVNDAFSGAKLIELINGVVIGQCTLASNLIEGVLSHLLSSHFPSFRDRLAQTSRTQLIKTFIYQESKIWPVLKLIVEFWLAQGLNLGFRVWTMWRFEVPSKCSKLVLIHSRSSCSLYCASTARSALKSRFALCPSAAQAECKSPLGQ